MLQFQHIPFLYGLAALIPLVILFVYVLKWKQNTKRLLGDERLVNQLTANYSPTKYRFKIIAVIAAIGLLIIAAANLRKPLAAKGTAGTGIDVMIALDVSKSMLSQDEKPTRLDKSKQLIYQLTTALQGNRIGLVVFAGQAYLQMPLTPDAGAAKMFASNASPNLVSMQGTVISDALRMCNTSLDTKEKKYKTAIVITDGEDHDDKALETVKELTDNGVIVHTIGVGSVEGTPIMERGSNEYKRDMNGQTIISKLNQPLLQQLTAATGGTYHQLTNTTQVADELVATLNGMEKKQLEAGGYRDYQSFYYIFLALALIFLVAEIFISERKKIQLA